MTIDRQHQVEMARETIDLLVALKDKWTADDASEEHKEMAKKMVGVEYGGDGLVGDFDEEFQQEFQRARDNGFKVSLRCAEHIKQVDS